MYTFKKLKKFYIIVAYFCPLHVEMVWSGAIFYFWTVPLFHVWKLRVNFMQPALAIIMNLVNNAVCFQYIIHLTNYSSLSLLTIKYIFLLGFFYVLKALISHSFSQLKIGHCDENF